MSRDDYDDRLLEEIRTIRKAIQRASESDNEREPAQEEIRRRKEEQEKRARIDRRRKAARIERRNKQKEERRRIKEEKLRKWLALSPAEQRRIRCIRLAAVLLLILAYFLVLPLPLLMASGFLGIFVGFIQGLDVIFDDGGSFIGSVMTLVLYPVSLVLVILRFIVALIFNLLWIAVFYLGYLPSLLFSAAGIDLISIGNQLFAAMGFGPGILQP